MSPEDMQTVIEVNRILNLIAAICLTLFPVLYAFSPWYRSAVGRAVMIQAVSIVLTVDITVIFQHIAAPTNFYTVLIINVVFLGFIIVASLYLTVTLFYYNFYVIKENDMPTEKPFLSNSMYNKLKWLAQIGLPALGSLYFAIAGIYGLPAAEQVLGTIVAVDTFLGVVLGLSTKAYKSSTFYREGAEEYDGVMKVSSTETGLNYNLVVNGDPSDLKDKPEAIFKVEAPPPETP